MFAHNSPPARSRRVVGDRWREMWLERLAAAASGSTLAAPPAPRRVLEARLGVRGLRRHPVRGLRRRRLGGRLLERDPATHGRADGPKKGLIGQWAHRYPAHGAAGPGRRLPAGLACAGGTTGCKGVEHRHRRRAAAARVDAGQRAARTALRDACPGAGSRSAAGRPPRITARSLRAQPRPPATDRPGAKCRSTIRSPETVGPTAGHWCPLRRCTRTCRSTSASRTAAR